MRYRYEHVSVRISGRTLWVGMDAYPLQSIARLRPLRYAPGHAGTVWTFLKQAGTWIAVGVGGSMLLACLGESTTGANAVLTLGVLAVLTLHTVRFVRGLTAPTLYALSVETARPHMALVSRDEGLIDDLIRRVVHSIDNPAAEFEMNVENIVLGDTVAGDKFVGDKVGGDKVTY